VSRTRLTPLLLVPLAAAGTLTGLAALTDDVWLFLLATAALGVGIAGVAARPRLAGLTYSFDGPARTTVGATVTHSFGVHNAGRRPTPPLRLTHRAPGFDDVTLAVPPLRAGGTASVELRRVARRRTHAEVHHTVVSGSTPLGLLWVHDSVEARSRFVVHPAIDGYSPAPPAPAEADAAEGRSTTARDGTEPGTVREWRPGDATSDVHWRSTARRGQLVVMERERVVQARRLVLVAGPAAAPDFEHVVAAVAASAVAAVRTGGHVALTAAGHGLCDGPPTALLDWCAALGEPGAPDAEVVAAALRWTGRDGELLLAAPADWRSEWWTATQRLVTSAGGRLSLFPATGHRR
jgi:uncharacterized protein (DUF58 family)